MKKYLVTFYLSRASKASIEVYSEDWEQLESFIKEAYSDMNFDYVEL